MNQNKTAIVYDDLFLKHDLPQHPENANRLRSILKELDKSGLLKEIARLPIRKATTEELLTTHLPHYVEKIKSISESQYEGTTFYNPHIEETYLNQFTYDAAMTSVGAAIELNIAIYDRIFDNGMALLRPPSHHARVDEAMGFCFFASEVIAAKYLQKYRQVKKVAIVDFDVHHCNGTQELTLDNPDIISLSIHQHPLWPMTGILEVTGNNDATGTNINCPFPSGAGDYAYLTTMEKIVIPKLKEFQPEHIIVFAGYDAHWRDPLANHRVTVDGYRKMSSQLINTAKDICQGRICFSLGGGYDLLALSKSVASTIRELLGSHPNQRSDEVGTPSQKQILYEEEIEKIKNFHFKQHNEK